MTSQKNQKQSTWQGYSPKFKSMTMASGPQLNDLGLGVVQPPEEELWLQTGEEVEACSAGDAVLGSLDIVNGARPVVPVA